MLINASIKYFNLETRNLNNTDKIYFNKIRSINLENVFKLNQIELKYDNELQKLKDEQNKKINEIQNQNNENNNINNIKNFNIDNNIEDLKNKKILLDDNKK